MQGQESSVHARNVALVLNPVTGLVSPQFHVKFDDAFETTKDDRTTQDVSMWQTLAGFNVSVRQSSGSDLKPMTHVDVEEEEQSGGKQATMETSANHPQGSISQSRPAREVKPRELLSYDKGHVQTIVSLSALFDDPAL